MSICRWYPLRTKPKPVAQRKKSEQKKKTKSIFLYGIFRKKTKSIFSFPYVEKKKEAGFGFGNVMILYLPNA